MMLAGFDMNTLVTIAIALPFIGAIIVNSLDRWPNVREGATLITAVLLFIVVLALYQPVMAGQSPEATWFYLFPGLSVSFSLEPLGMIFALIASFLWIVTSIYAIGYMRGHHETNQTRFFTCFALAISSVMGIALADNLLTLFIFYEVLTFSTYPLVTHAGTDAAKRGGRIYLSILVSTSVAFLLFAILATWHFAGTLDFKAGGILADKASPAILSGILVLFAFGIGKAALMPFHHWLPNAMVAPTPVSALLHAVAVVKAGVFSVLKVAIYIFGIDTLKALPATDFVLYVGAFTIVLASLIAMTKDNLKARLAYSTVSQLSYIIVGAMLASSAGILGGSMHIATHAFGKITLFFCAGAIMVAAHKNKVSELVGIGKAMPLTMVAFMIGTLSIIGLPPLGGTWSKWFLMMGALETHHLVIVGVLIVSTLLNIAYLLPIPIRAFYSTESDKQQSGLKEAPLPCLIAMTVTSIGCLLLFFYPEPFYALANKLPGVSL
tara:strand:+ start:2492 stop:3973 length:1482 start_codon:yes stop_codon:yes gene_type:complete